MGFRAISCCPSANFGGFGVGFKVWDNLLFFLGPNHLALLASNSLLRIPDGSDEGTQWVAFAAAGLKIGIFPLKLPDV